MKRTLIFVSIDSEAKEGEDKMVIILEGTRRHVEMFQKGLEHKFAVHGWFLGKVIKHRTKQHKNKKVIL